MNIALLLYRHDRKFSFLASVNLLFPLAAPDAPKFDNLY